MTQTGETIWTKTQSINSWPHIIRQLKVWPDRPTVFVATQSPEIDGLPCLIDADTGKEIWRIKGAQRVPAKPIQIDSRDLDADGKPEIIYVAVQAGDYGERIGSPTDSATIYCINGATGRVTWEREILSGISALDMPEMQDDSSWSPTKGAALSTLLTADFNQDGTQDVLIADAKDANRVLTAIDGKDGTLLWQHPLVGSVDRYRGGDVPRPVLLQDADGVPLIGLTDLSANQAGVTAPGVRITLKLIDGKNGRTLDSRNEVVQEKWSRVPVYSIWHHRGRFALHVLADKQTDQRVSGEVGEYKRQSHRLGWLVQGPHYSQHYYVFDVANRKLKQDQSIELFNRRKDREDLWLQCWLEPSSSNVLVTATQKQCTRYNLSNGEIESQVKWDSSYGSLETVQGVDFANGGQKIIGRCSGDHTTWVSMNVNDGSIDWRLPIYSSLGGDSWGVGYRLFRRAGNEPPRIALNNSRSQTVLQTIGTGKRSPDPIATSVSQKEAGSLEDRRYIRNLPAARNVETSIDRVVASLVSTIFGLGIFVVPFLYLRKLFKRQFSIRFFFAAFPVVLIVMATLSLSTPKMWSTVSSPLSSLTFGLLGTTLIVALFTFARATLQRRWLVPTLAVLCLIVAICFSVVLPIVYAWIKTPSIRFNVDWAFFIDPSLLVIHAFGLVCIIVFGIKGFSRVLASLLNQFRTKASPVETNLGESQSS